MKCSMMHAREAITSGLAINHILRLSLCHILKTSDLIKNIPEDYMHLGPERVANKLLDMFVDKPNIGISFYLGRALNQLIVI